MYLLAFNLQVGSQTSVVEMIPTDLQQDFKGPQWDVFTEKAGIWDAADFTQNGLVDHINTTKDTTDYLWYTTRFVNTTLFLLFVFSSTLNYWCKSSQVLK